MVDEKLLCRSGIHVGWDAEVDDRTGLALHCGRDLRDRWGVDGEHRGGWTGPEAVGDGVIAPERTHAVEGTHVVAESRGVDGGATPGVGMVQSVDRRLTLGITQSGQAHEQGLQGIRSSTAEHSRVRCVIHRAHGHEHAAGPPQRGRQGREAGLDVAGVGQDDRVGGDELGSRPGDGLHAAAALLLRTLDDHGDLDRPLPQDFSHRPQGEQQGEEVALAVGGPAREPASVPFGEGPRVAVPVSGVTGRHDIMVGIEEH